MVLENDVVFGTVNANRRHYEAAAAALARADRVGSSGWSRAGCRSSAGPRRWPASPRMSRWSSTSPSSRRDACLRGSRTTR
jgi:hypothetical protein